MTKFIFCSFSKNKTNNKTNQQINKTKKNAEITKRFRRSTSENGAFTIIKKEKIGGSIEPVTPIMTVKEPPKKEPEPEITGKGAKKTAWVKHVADFAHKNNMNYFEALKDPKVKEGYSKK